MKTPNIFNYATKELSQDAVISWLIKWSETDDESELAQIGIHFVKSLLNHNQPAKVNLESGIHEVEVHQQDHKIDVLARINKKHVLLIEDKTYSEQHGKQLERFRDIVLAGKTKLGKVSEKDLYLIYFKSGYVYDDERESVECAGYRVFDANDWLTVLQIGKKPYKQNTLCEFFEYLTDLTDRRQRALSDWDMRQAYVQWRFMVKLSDKLALQTHAKWPARGSSLDGTSWTQFPHWIFDREGKNFFWRLDSSESCSEPRPLRLMVQTKNILGGRERFLDFADEWYDVFAETAELSGLTLTKFRKTKTHKGEVINEPPIGAVNIDDCLKQEGLEKCIEKVSRLYKRFTDAVGVM